MELKSKNLLLLTGAGFTKNFDGFLGNELWAKVFNNPLIQKNDKLRGLLQEDADFESVYVTVDGKDSGFSVDEKRDFQDAIEDAYKSLDDAVRSWTFNRDNPTALDVYKLFGGNGLLGLFNAAGQEQGFIFTLNQDLLLERRLKMHAVGAPLFPQEFYQFDGKQEFINRYFVELPKENVEAAMENSIKDHAGVHYVKLHGSYGWKSSDGSSQMALGKNKWEILKNEPLLFACFNLFTKIIKDGNKKLLIIGYGFKDSHINDILLDGVLNHGLKIYVITTMSIEEFDESLKNSDGMVTRIKDGLSGYFPHRLNEIFPPNQNGSVHLNEIKRALKS